jgi:hypothetical protein
MDLREALSCRIAPNFRVEFAAYRMAKVRESGASAEEIARKSAQIQQFAERYKNPFFNAAITFVEPLPIGLLVALISAGVLSRRRRKSDAVLAASAAR